MLTSVSILTTGFDEPTVQKHHPLPGYDVNHALPPNDWPRRTQTCHPRRSFTIIDLGNNIQRFGEWQQPVDWKYVFRKSRSLRPPTALSIRGEFSSVQSHAHVTAELRAQFPNTLELTFDIEGHYQEAIDTDKKPKIGYPGIHSPAGAKMCLDNAETLSQAIALAKALHPEIEWRVKQYVKCLDNASKNYREWLMEDYQNRLEGMIKKLYARMQIHHAE